MFRTLNRVVKKYFAFEPYKKKIDIAGIDADFFYATEQAKTWYDPLQPYAKLEYEWVLQNIDLQGKNILDGGAHHGQYSIVFGKGAKNQGRLIAVDPFPMNCVLTDINMRLNDLKYEMVQSALSTRNGVVHFTNKSNGNISDAGELEVKTYTVSHLMPDVQVIKLDIEGEEFNIVPAEIDALKKIEAWIIEVHPQSTKDHPDKMIKLFTDRGYKVKWVNRDKNIVEDYQLGTDWKIHSTIFCMKN